MDTFFTYLRKTLVGIIAILFAVVVLYTPQDFVPKAEAGAAYGGSAVVTQVPQFVKDTINAGVNLLSSVSNFAIDNKELYLDGVAWAIVKRVVISMADQLVDWINSGFAGRPGFVQNVEEFLRDQADAAVGEYIQNLGELGSFLCDPFKLDVSVALTIALDNRHQPAPTCRLSEVVDNFDDFTSGARGSFSQGGWDDWFDITSSPERHTAFGAYATAEVGALAQISTTRNEEDSLLDFANGFLSMRQCEKPEGEGATTKCSVGTPGKLIQETITNNLDTNRQIMVEADEFNELITGFIGTIAGGSKNALFASFVNSVSGTPTESDVNSINQQRSSRESSFRGEVNSIENNAESDGEEAQEEADEEAAIQRGITEEEWEAERARIKAEILAELAEESGEEEEEGELRLGPGDRAEP